MKMLSCLPVLAAGMTVLVTAGWCDRAFCACGSDSLEVPQSLYDTSGSPFLGHAVGETFYARDTLITKITVWRPPNNQSVIGAHLFITAVDTTQSPPRPDTGNILLDGPTVHVFDSTPPGGAIEMPFVIDPPLALPHQGYYAWFLQAEDCNQGEAWIIEACDTNPYSQGIYWLTGRATTSCFLAAVEGGADNIDLLFRIDFCGSATTPVRQRSWGEVKVRYR